MSVFDKIKFWKKEDDLDFDALASKEMGKSSKMDLNFEQDNLGLEEKSPFNEEPSSAFEQGASGRSSFSSPAKTQGFREQPTYSASTSSGSHDLELINSKLDTVKAILLSLDQRLERLERSTGTERKEKLW